MQRLEFLDLYLEVETVESQKPVITKKVRYLKTNPSTFALEIQDNRGKHDNDNLQNNLLEP